MNKKEINEKLFESELPTEGEKIILLNECIRALIKKGKNTTLSKQELEDIKEMKILIKKYRSTEK